jgi:hypothetical protein
VAPSSVTLADHLASLRRLLHDASDVLFSNADKIAYINEAIQQRDLDTGGQRALVTFSLTASQERYTFSDLQASGSFADGPAASANIFDVIGITLIYSGYRILLEQWSFSEMQSFPGYRAYTNTIDRPAAWCRRGPNAVIIAPTPSLAYSSEWDVLVYANPGLLVATTDPDPLPYPFTYPVPLYAAYLAKQNERQYDEAEFFLNRYQMAVNQINAVKAGSVPTFYPSGLNI